MIRTEPIYITPWANLITTLSIKRRKSRHLGGCGKKVYWRRLYLEMVTYRDDVYQKPGEVGGEDTHKKI